MGIRLKILLACLGMTAVTLALGAYGLRQGAHQSQQFGRLMERMFDRGLISLADDLSILVSRQVNDADQVWALVNRDRRARAPADPAARPRRAPHLRERLPPVGDEVQDQPRDDHIDRGVPEGDRRRAASVKHRPARQVLGRGFEKSLGGLDAAHGGRRAAAKDRCAQGSGAAPHVEPSAAG